MSKNKMISPEQELYTADPGDITNRRDYFQSVYAAILSLSLIEKDDEFSYLFCEHHEDILMRKTNGKLIGVQVTSRNIDLGPFKSTDKKITDTLKRFIKHENSYPGWFDKYLIATNNGFWNEDKNKYNLQYIIKLVKDSVKEPETLQNPDLLKYIEIISKKAECTSDTVINVLMKMDLEGDLPKLRDIEVRLITHIKCIQLIGDQYYSVLKDAAKQLADMTDIAGSIGKDSPVLDYVAILNDPITEKNRALIEGKKITKEQVLEILKSCISKSVLLGSANYIPLSELPRRMRKMEIKMAAGGISPRNIELMKDLKYSAEIKATSWLHKNESEANKKYQHIRTLVNNECQMAYDSTKKRNELFGSAMYSEVRRRLENRYQSESKEVLCDCLKEQLFGFAGILTEECKIWWSDEFEIVEETP